MIFTDYLHYIRIFIKWKALFYKFKSITDIDALVKNAYNDKHMLFIQYYDEKRRQGGRRITDRLVEHLKINFDGLRVLELGPGYGHLLDIAQERGARAIEFVDYDPYIYHFNRLKGCKGYFVNYYRPKGFSSLLSNKYDFILSKGSINADFFNRIHAKHQQYNVLYKFIKGYIITFDTWLEQLESMTALNGQVVITPGYDRGNDPERPDLYVCGDKDEFMDSRFSSLLRERGFNTIYIEGYNHPEMFPFTFYKKKNE